MEEQTRPQRDEQLAERDPDGAALDPGAASAAADGMSRGKDHKVNLPEAVIKYDPAARRHITSGGSAD